MSRQAEYNPSPSGERDSLQSKQGEGPFRRNTSATDLRLAREARANMTQAETRLWNALRNRRLNGWKFKRQLPIGGFRRDFVCDEAKLNIEVDGSQHGDMTVKDGLRTEVLERQGYQVLRFWNNDVIARLDMVLDAILAATSPHPGASRLSLSPEGEGEVEGDLR